jgi:hypothetical protein
LLLLHHHLLLLLLVLIPATTWPTAGLAICPGSSSSSRCCCRCCSSIQQPLAAVEVPLSYVSNVADVAGHCCALVFSRHGGCLACSDLVAALRQRRQVCKERAFEKLRILGLLEEPAASKYKAIAACLAVWDLSAMGQLSSARPGTSHGKNRQDNPNATDG